MAANPIGVLDLSIVTGLLVQTLEDYWTNSPLWTLTNPSFAHNISQLTPDETRKTGSGGSECQVTVTLIHIEPNKYNRNFVYPAPQPPVPNPPPPRSQAIPFQPLALDLFYFVTAFSEGNAIQEQQAMSIVLNCFYQNPILRTNVLFPGSPAQSTREEFTLTMEVESVDSISRLWQAITVPFRLSLMYRVAVVFMTPPAALSSAKQVSRYGLSVQPTSFPFAQNGQVFGTSSTTTFISPDLVAGVPQNVDVNYSPATVTPGQRFFLYGAGLNQGTDYAGPPPNPGTSYRVYLLLPPDYQTEREVTAQWKAADVGSPAGVVETASRITLDLPGTVGPLPGGAPTPGVYLLRAGSNTPADAVTNRTSSTPFSVAARVDVPASPAIPILPQVGGVYTVKGMGFVAGQTEVLLDTVALDVTTSPPGPGQFSVLDIATVEFRTPTNLTPGRYSVRIRVNGVESPPALWINL